MSSPVNSFMKSLYSLSNIGAAGAAPPREWGQSRVACVLSPQTPQVMLAAVHDFSRFGQW